jgi:hypothetical protein
MDASESGFRSKIKSWTHRTHLASIFSVYPYSPELFFQFIAPTASTAAALLGFSHLWCVQSSSGCVRGLGNPIGGERDMTHPLCPWCERSFTPRSTGGRRQRFCCERCRRAYERELRAWARNQITSGSLTPAELQRARSLGALSPGSEAK